MLSFCRALILKKARSSSLPWLTWGCFLKPPHKPSQLGITHSPISVTPQCPSHLQCKLEIITLALFCLWGSFYLMIPHFSFIVTEIHCPQSLKTLVPRSVFLFTPRSAILLCMYVCVDVVNQSCILVCQLFDLTKFYSFGLLLQNLLPWPSPCPAMTPNCPYLETQNSKHLTFWLPTPPITFSPSFFSQFIRTSYPAYTPWSTISKTLISASHSPSICPFISCI